VTTVEAGIRFVHGDEELLASRAVAEVVAQARVAEPDCDIRDLPASAVRPGDLYDLLSPSLFGERRVVVLRDCQEAAKDLIDALLAYVADPAPEVSLIVVHSGGNRGKALVEGMRAARVRTVQCAKLTRAEERLDFINAMRVSTAKEAYRVGHRFGNRLLSGLVRQIFGRQFNDMLSGYKVLSRRFVKSFPAMSSGFETETELTVHALELRMPSTEIVVAYKERPPGSVSKLRTYSDGVQIMMLIARLVKDERPLHFFGFSGFILIVAAVLLSIPLLLTYLETGLVPRIPTAILSVALVIVGVLCVFVGLVLDMTTKTRREMKRLVYLSLPHLPLNTQDSE